MIEALFYILMLVTAGAALFARGLTAAAREHVRQGYPAWYEQLSAKGSSLRLSGPDDRARRRITRPLIFGNIPAEARDDAVLAMMASRLRASLLITALGFAGVAAVIALRSQGA
jgi:hypothetical protein